MYELLNYKWIHFGLPVCIFHFIFYAMAVGLLTSMVLVAPLPHGPVCSCEFKKHSNSLICRDRLLNVIL